MKYGIREICDVVFKAKSTMQVGNKIFYKNEPVIYFDTLKTSTLEGAATTVYAQGGRGNSRLMAWEGERTVTFTMEDALISTVGIMVLTGAGLVEAKAGATLKVHTTETTDDVVVEGSNVTIYVTEKPYVQNDGDYVYVMALENGEVSTEPYIPDVNTTPVAKEDDEVHAGKYALTIKTDDDTAKFKPGMPVLVDFYVEHEAGVQQIEITPDKFGGNFYVEASTLFRDTNGVDLPAEFIIPNCKVQSNFTFTMASSGDPSTFTFTCDAFPDYTRFDPTKKVLCAIQTINTSANTEYKRDKTATAATYNEAGMFVPVAGNKVAADGKDEAND